jgi:hypothetical protein
MLAEPLCYHQEQLQDDIMERCRLQQVNTGLNAQLQQAKLELKAREDALRQVEEARDELAVQLCEAKLDFIGLEGEQRRQKSNTPSRRATILVQDHEGVYSQMNETEELQEVFQNTAGMLGETQPHDLQRIRGMGGGRGSWPPDWGGWAGSPGPLRGDTSGCVWCGKRLVVVSRAMTGGL